MSLRALSRSSALLGAALVIFTAAQVATSRAATPADGRLTPTSGKVTWTGGPLNGSASALRRITCTPGVTCDEFMLDVNLPASAFPGRIPVMRLTATTDAPNAVQIIVYRPGEEPNAQQNNFDYYSGGDARIRAPLPGRWRIRVGCNQCVNASYTATAAVESIPIPRNNAPAFASQVLPGPEKDVIEGAAEPGIEIGPKGEIWVNGPGSVADFWASYDGGETFTLHQPDVSPTTGDTWATIGGDGTVYADNLSHAGGTNLVYVSKDRGQTWNGLPFVANTDSDRQWLTADPKNPGTVYFQYHELATANNVWVWKTTDYGQTWLPVSHISVQELLGNQTFDTPPGNTTGPIIFGPDGTLHFVIAFSNFTESATAAPTEQDFYLTKIFVLSSTDGGMNWDFTVARDTASAGRVHHGFAWISPDRAGNLYLAWSERPADSTETSIFLATSRDKAKTWSAPVRVDRRAGSNVFPAVGAEGDPGRVSIAWLESQAKNYDDHSAQWRVVMAQTANAFDAKPAFSYLQVSPDVMHEADICQSGTLCLVTGGNRTLLDYIHMDIDAQGFAHIVYTDDTSGVRTVYAKQVGGMSTRASQVKGARITKPKPKPQPKPATKPAGDRLPATGVGSGGVGILLLAMSGLLRRRLRAARV